MDAARSAISGLCATISDGENWKPLKNEHPTIKPLALLRYLLGLVTMPERNLILDPFAGSGSTGVACRELGLPCILIDADEHACEIAASRLAATQAPLPLQPQPEEASDADPPA